MCCVLNIVYSQSLSLKNADQSRCTLTYLLANLSQPHHSLSYKPLPFPPPFPSSIPPLN